MFKATQNKGFCITFANGYEVSVQFGRGIYCENRDLKDNDQFITESKDAEVMAWNKDGDVILQPQGWQTPEEVINILMNIMNK